jgi:zinc transport system permease protein
MVDMFEIIPNSFYACLLVSVAVGIIGSLIVINRNSFIAGSIAHGSFGGVGIGLYFGLPILLSTSLFGALLALLLSAITLKIPHRSDAIIGAIWAIGMSVGIIFVELSPGYGDGVISYLFGSILTISDSDIFMMIGVDLMLLLFIVIFYNQILLLSYDKEFASIKGLNTLFLHTLLFVLISQTIVMSVRAVGLILIIALFTLPPFIAEKFTKSLKGMIILSSILSIFFMVGGIIISFYYNFSATATIIILATIAFFISFLI